MSAMPRLNPLAFCLAAALALASPIAEAANLTVINCNDSGAGSLRSAIASAASTGPGDTVVFDTAQMGCSTITLTSGQIAIDAAEITLQGPTTSTLTIGGFHASRVFFDYGADHNRKLTINNLTIANGTMQGSFPSAILQGGCILASGDVILSASTVTGCVVDNVDPTGDAAGGAVASYKLHMQNSVISNNQAYGYTNALGGGAFTQDEMMVRSSLISGNKSAGLSNPFASGGGLASQNFFGAGAGGIQIVSSTISGNESDFGGGVAMLYGSSSRAITIDHSTISGNQAHRYSGGVHIYANTSTPNITANIVDSTISGNHSFGTIGGVYNNGTLTVSNSTIAFNRADSGVFNVNYAEAAGLYTRVATLQSSIIANNTVGVSTESDLNGPTGPTMLGSNNLIMATLTGTTAPAGTLIGDPLLGALADNGGPTLTRALLNGSPAIGTGNNLANLASDQRGPGFGRATYGKTDIGAFQTGDGIFRDGFQ